ncbi:MAG: dCTP deaminase [Minisyncoccales bacterium]
MILSDKEIKEQVRKYKMIQPFHSRQIRKNVISFGLSSFGYDFRIDNQFKIFTNAMNAIVDPKNFDSRSFINFKGKVCVIPPNSFILAKSVEYFRIPRNILGVCLGKSTYARCGIIVNVTPLEPEWEGFITVEISNTTPLPAKIYSREGICQVIFLKNDSGCEISYSDRKGKYQKQKKLTLPKV